MSDRPIRVVLADDHAIVRGGLRLLLEAEPDLEVAAEAGTVEEARRYVRGHRADVLVLDLNMPGGSSLEAIPGLLEEHGDLRVVVLTMQREPAFARSALQAGASGYVLKDAAGEELVAAIRAAVAGELYLNPALAAKVAVAPPADAGPPGGLSEREAEVLRLVALGHTNAEIAERLYLSVRTIETHRSHLQQKLRLGTRAELVAWALEHRLVGPPAPDGA